MNPMFRKTLLAGAIATLIASPVWAQSQTETPQAAPGQTTEPMERAPETTETPATPSAPSAATTPSTQASNPLYTMTPEQLKGMDVVGASGDKIGSVKSVVRGRDAQDIQAVIASGGVLGLGAKEVAVSLDELQLMDDKLQIGATQEELEARGEYVKEQYVELEPEDQPISEFSAFEATPQDPADAGRAPDAGTDAPATEPMQSPPSPGSDSTYQSPPASGDPATR